MAGKRKRKRTGQASKNLKQFPIGTEPIIQSSLLDHYYHEVVTLREFILSKIPPKSKIRRLKAWSLGKNTPGKTKEFVTFLDKTLIGVTDRAKVTQQEKWEQWNGFSQNQDETSLFMTTNVAERSQSEIVDFAIWLLFSKSYAPTGRSQHILCQGYRKYIAYGSKNKKQNINSAIPGVHSVCENFHVTHLRLSPWPKVLAQFGREGEKAMLDLLLDCGIYVPVENSAGNYHQLSGFPLYNLDVLPDKKYLSSIADNVSLKKNSRTPSNIKFIRNRMMYAQADTNKNGGVRFGLKHIHALNRFPIPRTFNRSKFKHDKSTIQLLMYIFPRQFGLHNVFSHETNLRQTFQTFHDYTLREDEIKKKFPCVEKIKVPKRIRGNALNLIKKMQISHKRCPYKLLLDYYCPIGVNPKNISEFNVKSSLDVQIPSNSTLSEADTLQFKTQLSISATPKSLDSTLETKDSHKDSMMDHATPSAMVSAFCRAIFSYIIPLNFWGSSDMRMKNRDIFYRNVDRFVTRRRFESFSLHEAVEGLKITTIDWLSIPNSTGKICQSDISKRWELFHEFIYYLFDSILIPLIRSHFYVTESNVHRYRLFYFRHDIWRSITEPALTFLKSNLFEEISSKRAFKLLESHAIGLGRVRLLPKETGVRPILNLRKRAWKNGVLGRSINSILAPIHNVLTLEKNSKPERLGGSLSSVGDLFMKLKHFKSTLSPNKPLYFAKVDVLAAFDNIPQDAVLKLISNIIDEDEYKISRHVEMKPTENGSTNSLRKLTQKWTALAHYTHDLTTFTQMLKQTLSKGKRNTIFLENIIYKTYSRPELLHLLAQHINCSIVKIGNVFYRQKQGIPQGSVLSSLLCNYFYADLEAKHLSFLQNGQSLLLRLIDDFLLITTDASHAKKFLQIMHDGLPTYGVRVNPVKTLTNFEVSINARKISRVLDTIAFPYCGCLLNMKTLDITKDRERKKNMPISDSLTVEYSKTPGKIFQKKVLNAFKLQTHAMFLDQSHNCRSTVLQNIHSAFIETAMKAIAYIACLSSKRSNLELIKRSFKELVRSAEAMVKRRRKEFNPIIINETTDKTHGNPESYALRKGVIHWLALDAFCQVFRKKQTRYHSLIQWFEAEIKLLRSTQSASFEKFHPKGILPRE